MLKQGLGEGFLRASRSDHLLVQNDVDASFVEPPLRCARLVLVPRERVLRLTCPLAKLAELGLAPL